MFSIFGFLIIHDFPQIVNQLKQKLLTKEEEFEKLVKDSDQIKKDCESRCQKLEDMVKTVQDG